MKICASCNCLLEVELCENSIGLLKTLVFSIGGVFERSEVGLGGFLR